MVIKAIAITTEAINGEIKEDMAVVSAYSACFN